MKNIVKLFLIVSLTLLFTACEDKKQEEFKASLPMPEWDDNADKELTKYWSNWHDAKTNPIPATKIGYAYSEKLKDYNKALEWFKYSDSLKPLPQNSNYACYALQQLKKYNEAISWCEKAIELGSDEALFRLGYTYSKLDQYDVAISYYKKSFEKTKDKMTANNLGYIYSKVKDYKNAEIWYKKAIQEGNLEAYQGIATLYYEDLKDNIKASAYAIAVINTKYTKSSVLELLQNTWKIPKETIKKGYELQLNSPDFPVKFKGDLGL